MAKIASLTKAKTWDQVLESLRDQGIIPGTWFRILLFGPPRTGKTTAAVRMFNADEITCSKGQGLDDVLGGLDHRTVGCGTGVSGWNDGPAVRALKNGTAVVYNEIDKLSGELSNTMYALMDDPAGVTLPNGERVKAAPGYMVLATTNESPSKLPDALLDRFDLILECSTLSQGLRQRLGKLADAAQNSVKQCVQWTRPCSPNLLLCAAKMLEKGMPHDQIAAALYFGQEREQVDLVTLLARTV